MVCEKVISAKKENIIRGWGVCWGGIIQIGQPRQATFEQRNAGQAFQAGGMFKCKGLEKGTTRPVCLEQNK